MANGNDLKATLSVSLNQEATIRDINQAMKKLEKHPAFKSLSLKINLDQKMLSILTDLNRAREAMTELSVQTELAAAGMASLGEAVRTSAMAAYTEWNALGEQLVRIQALAAEASARSAEAVSGEAASGGLSGALSNAVSLMDSMTIIASFNEGVLTSLKTKLAALATMFTHVAASQGVVRASTQVLASAFMSLGKAILPLAIITGIVWGLGELYKAFSGTNDKTKAAERINLDHVNSLKQQRDELRQIAREYESLQAAQKAGYATIEQKQKLLSIQTELVKSYGVAASAISAEGEAFASSSAIKLRIAALTEEIAAQHKLDKLKLKAKDNERTDTIQNTEESISKDEAKIKGFQHKAVRLRETFEFEKGLESPHKTLTEDELNDELNIIDGSISKLIEGIETKRSNLKTALSETTDILRTELDLYLSTLQSRGAQVSDVQRAFMEGLINSIARNGQDLDSQINSIFEAHAILRESGFEQYLSDFNNAQMSGDVQGMENARKQVSSLLNDFHDGIAITDSFRNSILALFESGNPVAMSSEETAKFVRDSIKSLSSLENAYQKLNKGEQLSADTVTDLITLYPELAKYLAETNDFTFQKGQLLQQVMEQERANKIEEIKNSIQTTTNLRNELENKRRLREAYYIQVRGLDEALLRNGTINVMTPEEIQQENLYTAEIEKMVALLALLSQANASTTTITTSSVSKEKYKPNLNFSKAQLEVENYNRLLEKNNDEIQLAIAQGGLYDKRLANRISLYSELTKALNKLRSEQEQERNSLRTKLTKTGLVDSDGEVVADVEKRLLALSRVGRSARLGHSAEELEDFVGRYLELAGEIADTASQLRTATTDLADALQIGLDKIAAASNRKQDKAKHKIALLGEINTEEEKRLLAQYSNEIVKALAQELKGIDDQIAKANAVIQNKNSSKQEKDAYSVNLEALKKWRNQVEENLVQESEQQGKSQAEALVSGFDKTLEELKYAKSLLGNIDSEEERKKAAELDQQIYDTLTKGIERYNQDIVELERKLSTQLTDEERYRAQAKLEVLREYVKNYTLEQAQAVSAWENSVKSSAKDAMSALEDFYAKQGKAAQKALDDQLDAYRGYIEERKKLLRRENEAEDFSDNRAKLQKEEAELRKEIAVLSLDNSIEGQYKREQLEQELADKVEEIRRLELDRTRSLREQDYDDLLKNKEDEIKVAKDAADKKWQQDLAADQHYSALKQAVLEGNVQNMQKTLLDFSSNVQLYMNAIGESIDRNLVEKLEEAQRFQNLANTIVGIPNLNVSAPPPTSPNASVGSGAGAVKSARASAWEKYLENKQEAETLKNSDPRWIELNKDNNKLREIWGFQDKSYEQLRNLPIYHEGGEVGVEGTTTAKWWQGMLKSDEVLSVLRKGEAVIKDPGSFVQQMIASVAQRMNAGPRFLVSGTGASGPVTNHYEYDIRIERLEGGEAGAKALFKHIRTQSQRGNRL
ncbi:hypothetical protein B1A99_18545 [Cohnella sp. CIP 111063]|uniref:hypothetical protein n=1 Tax=unclassified Cohnella TaxID=2636738 RepID=UPI000B8C5568|nr:MULTISPECIES: hypothetical protein [unclassified Cohnella]OXS56862.1 hypothetical protein B1A99_18545 [Cohnella sp. CIP 111063]PRX69699.1 hypothetical protein B0G52_11257 [Cohnella sp. SGD-V74]